MPIPIGDPQPKTKNKSSIFSPIYSLTYLNLLFMINNISIQIMETITFRLTLSGIIPGWVMGLETMTKCKIFARDLINIIYILTAIQYINLTGLRNSKLIISSCRPIFPIRGTIVALAIIAPTCMNGTAIILNHKLMLFRPGTIWVRD